MMENTKLVLVFFCILMSSSCVTLCVSSSLDADIGDYFSAMAGGSVTCMEKLMPCQPYLVPGPAPPPANCCIPLKELIANDTKCICDTFNNPLVRGSLNVSMDDIMKLPKACNETFDLAVCNTTSPAKDAKGSDTKSSVSTQSVDSDSPPDNDNDNDSTPDNDSPQDSDSKASGANGKLSSSAGRGYIISLAFFVAFLVSVYLS